MAVTKADVELWHKKVAQASAAMALSLARGKRSSTMLDEVANVLAEVVDEIRAASR